VTRWLLLGGVGIACASLAAAQPRPDAAAGERAYQKCYACHALEPGKHDLSGPSLYRIVGRRIAAAPGFGYSPALRALARRRGRWDAALLDRFIADPESVTPRTSMTFTGMSDPRERADLIAYLRRAGRR
jgi:cytochrome c